MNNYANLSKEHLISLIQEKDKKISNLALLEKILALMPGNVYWKDRNSQFLGCNAQQAELLDLTKTTDIIGKYPDDFCSPQMAIEVRKIDQNVIDSETTLYVEEVGYDKNKNPAIYLTQKIPLRDDSNNIIGLLGVSFDITERKRMEEELKIAKEKAEASNYAKSQFLAVINHELRTPLASITGLLELLKQEQILNAEGENIMSAIENCTQYLLSLVNDVLEFSKLEVGQYKSRLSLNTLHLGRLIDEVSILLSPLAKNKKLELHIHSDENVPEYIHTDSSILKQILINLVSNAIKFTEKGHIQIQVKNQGSQANKMRLKIDIIDTGIGIPQDKQHLIFEPFEQLTNAYTRQSSRSGTGLGLAIVKNLAALINTTIQVISKPGKGSTFSIIGEFEASTAEPIAPTDLRKTQPEEKIEPIYPYTMPHQPKILLIEDDPTIQYIHTKMLIMLGCKVDAATRGDDAINQLDNHDIVFVDVSLPDMNGFDVIKTIRKRPHPTNNIPIIALTVYTGIEEKSACFAAGANDFATKPIHPSLLKELIIQYMK